jgi:hypothetical protein
VGRGLVSYTLAAVSNQKERPSKHGKQAELKALQHRDNAEGGRERVQARGRQGGIEGMRREGWGGKGREGGRERVSVSVFVSQRVGGEREGEKERGRKGEREKGRGRERVCARTRT